MIINGIEYHKMHSFDTKPDAERQAKHMRERWKNKKSDLGMGTPVSIRVVKDGRNYVIYSSYEWANPGAAWHTSRAKYWSGSKYKDATIVSRLNNFYAGESRLQGIPNPIRKRNPAKSNFGNLLILAGLGFLVYKLVKK